MFSDGSMVYLTYQIEYTTSLGDHNKVYSHPIVLTTSPHSESKCFSAVYFRGSSYRRIDFFLFPEVSFTRDLPS